MFEKKLKIQSLVLMQPSNRVEAYYNMMLPLKFGKFTQG